VDQENTMNAKLHYCTDPFQYQRRKTREVMVGKVGVGGANPIRVQSMTTSDTLNTEATVNEVIGLVEVGCEIVRITAPTVKDAENLKNIRDELRKRGCMVPLVADIHFLPKAAMAAVEYVEKIRINPGNYADKKKFAIREYTDDQYLEELARIEEAFTPLVKRCKELGRAMRIGTNHGSLSDRIMNRYGDTPVGMVESALEFVRICEKNDYRDIILSMKASNPKVMIQAYRLLAARMNELGMDYPFHLGVTEAGDGEDGRIKSAVGIGALLEDGIGDTVRVSLTEDSVHEIPVCRELIKPFTARKASASNATMGALPIEQRDPFSYARRKSAELQVGDVTLGGDQPIRVEIPVNLDHPSLIQTIRTLTSNKDTVAEIIQLPMRSKEDSHRIQTVISQFPAEVFSLDLSTASELLDSVPQKSVHKLCIELGDKWNDVAIQKLIVFAKSQNVAVQVNAGEGQIDRLKFVLSQAKASNFSRLVIGVGTVKSLSMVAAYRLLAAFLDSQGLTYPVQLRLDDQYNSELEGLLGVSRQFGVLLCDGLGDAIQVGDGRNPGQALKLAYNILQATGNRITKTEYVSCPSCGRTLFNLQTVTERIKSKTAHLKGVKIAIMGCIVNGPGEMADADFGYVGGAPGKVNLYVGKECVQYHVPESEADQKLIDLIKSHGKWQDVPEDWKPPVSRVEAQQSLQV
jgi:(E)-4-hydroxy-3-methylbut-2-enyl-diphosphate synthase